MWKAIRTNIFVGLILATPLVITAFVANWLFRIITNQFIGFFPPRFLESETGFLWAFAFRILSLLIVILILFIIGLFVRNIIGRRIYKLGDHLLTRIPFINRIYIFSRQIIDAFLTQRETVFNQVVMIQYPRKGVFAVGFLTASTPYSFRKHIPEGRPSDEYVAVFIPTTPNPTSGWLCFVPREDVTPMPYSAGDAMKMIVSAGAVYPGDLNAAPPPSLVDKLHQLFRREPPPPVPPSEIPPPSASPPAGEAN